MQNLRKKKRNKFKGSKVLAVFQLGMKTKFPLCGLDIDFGFEKFGYQFFVKAKREIMTTFTVQMK